MDNKESVLSQSIVETPEHSGNIPNWKTIPEVLHFYADKYPDAESIIFVYVDGACEAVTFKVIHPLQISIGVEKSMRAVL